MPEKASLTVAETLLTLKRGSCEEEEQVTDAGESENQKRRTEKAAGGKLSGQVLKKGTDAFKTLSSKCPKPI